MWFEDLFLILIIMMIIMNNVFVSVYVWGGIVVEFGFKILKKFNKMKCCKIRI